MATQTTTNTVNLTAEFGDGSEKTFSQNDPIDNQTTLISRINALSQSVVTNQILISDDNANFTRFKAAKIVSKTVTNLTDIK